VRRCAVRSDAAAYQGIDAGGVDWNPMLYRDWLIAPQDEMLCSWPCDAAWLYVNDGSVTSWFSCSSRDLPARPSLLIAAAAVLSATADSLGLL